MKKCSFPNCKRFVSLLMAFILAFVLAYPPVRSFAATSNDVLPPSNLASQLITPSNAKLTWDPVHGATGYKVYGITDGQLTVLGTTTSTSYTFNDLKEGSYKYVVSTLSAQGESGPCAPTSFTVTYPTMAAPATLTNKIQNVNDVVLNWTASQYANSYNIYQIAADNTKTLVSSVKASTTYTIVNAPAGSYTYAVSSVNSLYGESSLSTSTQVQIIHPTMTAPSKLTYSLANINDINLSWSAVTNATNYKVYQVVDGQKLLKSTTTGTNVAFANMPGGDYVYEVHSFSSRFGESQDGSQVSLNLVLPAMQTPTNLSYEIKNENDITLKWDAVSNATNYKIYQIIDGQKILKSTTAGTNATFSNMPGGDYVYEVHSFSNRLGESQDGSKVSLSLVLPAMEDPTNLSYDIKNGNDITLKWDAVDNATSYKVYQIVNGQKILRSATAGTTITYTNMPGGDYVYEVHSFSTRLGESQKGISITFSLTPPIMQPPTDLAHKINNATSLSLTWSPSENATGYKIYQITNGQKVLKSTVNSTTVSYTNMAPGEYKFEIHSYSARFGESPDGSTITVTMDGQTMQAPTNLVYNITNLNDITLRWTAVPFATSYKIYQKVDGQLVLKQTVNTTSATFTNMPSGDYDYIVNSVSTLLGESPIGAESTFSLSLPKMGAPDTLTYNVINGNDITLRWASVQYANNYKVYQIIDGEKVLKQTVAGTSVTFTNMPAGDYTYEVCAFSTRLGESEVGPKTTLSLTWPTMQTPESVTYTLTNTSTITLKWAPTLYATNYKIYQIVNGEKVLKQTANTNNASFNLPAGDYSYEVHSYSTRFGESQDGGQISFTLDNSLMKAPGNLTSTITNGNDITLRWTGVPYVTDYKVYQIIDGKKVLKQTLPGTSVTFTNMAAGDYNYEVHSFNSSYGESEDGSQTSFTLTWPTMQAPAKLNYNIANGNDIRLNWLPVPYATSYKVYQIVNGEKVLKQTLPGTGTTFVNMPAGDYSYEVYSYSSRFGESPIGSTLDFSLTWPVVQAPTLSRTISNINNITLTWNSVAWANEYRVYEIVNDTKQLLFKGNALSYKAFNLSEGTHNFQVTAYNTRFGESDPSNTLADSIIYPIMQAPLATIKVKDKTTAFICWDFVTFANGYNIYELIDNKPVLLVKNLNNLSYTFNNLPAGDHLYYVTSCSNSFGESSPSSTLLARIIIDEKAPVTTSNAPTNWSKDDVTVNLTATDDISGVAKTFYSVDDAGYQEGTTFTVANEGTHKISFYSVDATGNTETANTAYVKIDKSAPVTTSNAPTNWSKDDVTVSLTATDTLSGVAKTCYSIDDADYQE
ncbi:hypothetical protein, partial [Clostridium sp. HBUAS56017]|uniref:fibronectin type III domain-containing protein n=1 Tax=Clostridium sp. HBUAS56017 TaxID=2571128 RepID=UPI0011785C2F